MAAVSLADQFREHFGHRHHLYGVMLDVLADDLEAGGATARICRGYEDAPRGWAVQLRLLAGIFRVVLRGAAPELARFYPCLGGGADRHEVAVPLHAVLRDRADELHQALARPPQTNEVGRSAALLIGLFAAVRRHGLHRIRLLETGASAGLNLNVDRYRYLGDGWSWGNPDSPVGLRVGAAGAQPERFEITARRGCDLSPVEVSTREGAQYLTSFVWPFELERHARLAGALQVIREHPVAVDQESASAWLHRQLGEAPDPETLTVVWQSITRQYWPRQESRLVDELVDAARDRMPLAHVSLEGVPPRRPGGGYDVSVYGPLLRLDGEPLAHGHHHGPPVVLL